MGPLLATALVIGFWGLLWLGATWVGGDTRDGRDWSRRRPATGPSRRTFD